MSGPRFFEENRRYIERTVFPQNWFLLSSCYLSLDRLFRSAFVYIARVRLLDTAQWYRSNDFFFFGQILRKFQVTPIIVINYYPNFQSSIEAHRDPCIMQSSGMLNGCRGFESIKDEGKKRGWRERGGRGVVHKTFMLKSLSYIQPRRLEPFNYEF